MADQPDMGGKPVTSSSFNQPFDTRIIQFGVKGIQLNKAIDALDDTELTRMVNVTHDQDRRLTARPGQTQFATTPETTNHTIRRLNDPEAEDFNYNVGAGQSLYHGASGALTEIEDGFSGRPLTTALYRTPHTGEAWLYIGDRNQMRKVRVDGLVLPIGLPAPATAVNAALATEIRKSIAAFDSSDGTQAGEWTPQAGFDAAGNASGTPTLINVTDSPSTTESVYMELFNGAATDAYNSWMGKAFTLDLSTFDGTTEITDDDLIHIWMKVSNPADLAEIRIYFVCSETFSTSVLPGTAQSPNGDFYMKAFRASDFGDFIAGTQPNIEAQAANARHRALERALQLNKIPEDQREAAEQRLAALDDARTQALLTGAGVHMWLEYGVLGFPLRRGDFQRIGQTNGRDWSTITGIIVYCSTNKLSGIAMAIDDLYITGGAGLDSFEPGNSQYDWRYTDFDPRTGAESNPSPIMNELDFLDSGRRAVNLTPVTNADDALRQRFYRRGGTITENWYFVGQNLINGGAIRDDFTDEAIFAGDSLEIDHHQPVATVDSDGNTILNQPVPSIFGPSQDLLFACGDPFRPGDVYYCKPGEPDHWPPTNRVEVCSPSEELMNGCVYGSQPYVASRERLYALYPALQTTQQVSAIPTACKKGIISRRGIVVGPGGIYIVNRDGVFRTVGGDPEYIANDIQPIFEGRTVFGIPPIDFTQAELIQLEVHDNELWFTYVDTGGCYRQFVYSIISAFWRFYTFGYEVATVYSDEGYSKNELLMGGATDGDVFKHEGEVDVDLPIACNFRTGALDMGRPREDKMFGDLILDAERDGVDIAVQTYLNNESTANASQAIDAGSGKQRYIFDPFGETPQSARNISIDIGWSSDSGAPVIHFAGVSFIPQPEVTINRVTNWDDLGWPAEKYLTGVVLECNTGGENRDIFIEYDLEGAVEEIGPITINTSGRHKIFLSWGVVKANLVRIRPENDCGPWMLFDAQWLYEREPARISKWDSNHENRWDTYYTGLDLEVDTFGETKQIEVYVDQALINTFNISASGRRVVHLTFGPGRGHVYRFRSIDNNPGLLYSHRWHLDQEPSEQTNWNQNFTIAGTHTDKWVKGVIIECDTFGATKTVQVQVDDNPPVTLSVSTSERRVLHFSFPQVRGRVLRLLPTDSNPGRLYTWQPIFDEEPLGLTRWETQELDHGIPGWKYPLWGFITLRSSDAVTLRISVTRQNASGATVTNYDYTLDSTSGLKQKLFVPFLPMKGVLYKWLLTSPQPFWLYREESSIFFRPWGTVQTVETHPFGNDDLDLVRGMHNATLTAARGGGGSSARE